METSQSLSIESFSYSWLVNLKPSLESLDNSFRASIDACDEASFIEMDPRGTPSKRFFKTTQDIKFDFPISQSPLNLVHADELFSEGYVMPFVTNSMEMEAFEASDHSTQATSTSTSSHAPQKHGGTPSCSSSFRRCRKLSRRMFLKYLFFLRPLYQRIRGQKSSSTSSISTGSDDNRRMKVKKNWVYSETSPRISVAYSADDWRRSCDSESSIYDAVLHCKKSIEK